MSQATGNTYGGLPAEGFVREAQLVPNPKRPNEPKPLPFGHATLWRLVSAGKFPKPLKLGPRITAWRASDVRAWIDEQGKPAEAA